MDNTKRIAIVIPIFLIGFFIYRVFFTKIPGEVNKVASESIQIFNDAMNLHEKDISVPINERFLQSIQNLSSKTAYLRQKYPDSPEISNCLSQIDLYNDQVLNLFTRVNGTILLTDWYDPDDFDRDSDENLKTQDSMLKACWI